MSHTMVAYIIVNDSSFSGKYVMSLFPVFVSEIVSVVFSS